MLMREPKEGVSRRLVHIHEHQCEYGRDNVEIERRIETGA